MSAELMKTVEQLNSKVASLNNERSRQLGMQEAAKDQYAKALQAYELKYGVKLTEANLQEEYNKVYAETKGNVLSLQTAIESIERGDYKNVERPKDIDLEPNVEIKQPEPKVVAPKEEPKVESTPSTPLTSAGLADATSIANTSERPPINFGALSEQAQAQQSAANLGGINFGGVDFGGDLGTVQATQPTQQLNPISFGTTDTAEDEDEESFSPAGWGTPKSTDEITQHFADILNTSGIKFGQ